MLKSISPITLALLLNWSVPASSAPINWVGKALNSETYDLARAQVTVRRPDGLSEKDPDPMHHAVMLSADNGPTLTLAQVPAAPADLDAVKQQAKMMSKNATIHAAEVIEGGYRLSYEMPGGIVRHKVWLSRGGVTISCTAGLHGLLPSAPRAPARAWLAEICDSMQFAPLARMAMNTSIR